MANTRPPSPPALALRDELARYVDVLEVFRHSVADQGDPIEARQRVESCISALGRVRSLCDSVADDDAAESSWQQHERRALFSVAEASFVAQCDLRPLVQHLSSTRQNDRELLEAVQRKLRRACNRVLAPLGPLVGHVVDSASFSLSVLETSLAVRRHYARFRRALPRVDTSPQSVRNAIIATADLVADVMRHVDASDIRIQDEMVLNDLRARAATWLATSQTPESGRQLFTDVCSFAIELRRVSERRELRVHDAKHVADALMALDATTLNTEVLAAALKALEGFDDELDQLYTTATRERAPATILGVRDRLRTLQAQTK